MSFKSNYISTTSLKGLNRVGDILCPGDGEFPSYSTLGCIEHVDIALEYAPPADINDLGLLLAILAYMPSFVLRWLVNQMAESHESNGHRNTGQHHERSPCRGVRIIDGRCNGSEKCIP